MDGVCPGCSAKPWLSCSDDTMRAWECGSIQHQSGEFEESFRCVKRQVDLRDKRWLELQEGLETAARLCDSTAANACGLSERVASVHYAVAYRRVLTYLSTLEKVHKS